MYKLVLKNGTGSTLSNGAMESTAFPLRQCLILYEALLKNHYTLPRSLRNTQKTRDDCFKVTIAQLWPHIHLLNIHTHIHMQCTHDWLREYPLLHIIIEPHTCTLKDLPNAQYQHNNNYNYHFTIYTYIVSTTCTLYSNMYWQAIFSYSGSHN